MSEGGGPHFTSLQITSLSTHFPSETGFGGLVAATSCRGRLKGRRLKGDFRPGGGWAKSPQLLSLKGQLGRSETAQRRNQSEQSPGGLATHLSPHTQPGESSLSTWETLKLGLFRPGCLFHCPLWLPPAFSVLRANDPPVRL